jgi:hypothetical protein
MEPHIFKVNISYIWIWFYFEISAIQEHNSIIYLFNIYLLLSLLCVMKVLQ